MPRGNSSNAAKPSQEREKRDETGKTGLNRTSLAVVFLDESSHLAKQTETGRVLILPAACVRVPTSGVVEYIPSSNACEISTSCLVAFDKSGRNSPGVVHDSCIFRMNRCLARNTEILQSASMLCTSLPFSPQWQGG